MRSFTHQSLSVSQVSKQCLKRLKQFLRYLADKVKMLNFSKGPNKNIYGLWMEAWTVSKIICILWKKAGGACPWGSGGSMSLNAACHKEQQYIWFMGGNLNSFRDITHFIKWREWGMPPGGPLWDPWSMWLNAPHHKEQEYIWFIGGYLNGFQDIKHFVKWRGWGMPLGTSRGPKIHVTKCALS